MLEPFIGAVILFAGNFQIRGYAYCAGQLQSIAQNTALFSILGTTYGGDGRTTFALPDLRGRVPVGMGQGPGLPDYQIGQVGGTTTTTLLVSNLPPHNHTSNLPTSTTNASSEEPNGNILATTAGNSYAAANTANGAYGNGATTGVTGGGQPINIESPYLAMNYLIALQGIFPSRN